MYFGYIFRLSAHTNANSFVRSLAHFTSNIQPFLLCAAAVVAISQLLDFAAIAVLPLRLVPLPPLFPFSSECLPFVAVVAVVIVIIIINVFVTFYPFVIPFSIGDFLIYLIKHLLLLISSNEWIYTVCHSIKIATLFFVFFFCLQIDGVCFIVWHTCRYLKTQNDDGPNAKIIQIQQFIHHTEL